jgi:prepilin-type N-terminal cleavage/methylation domain-containing protein
MSPPSRRPRGFTLVELMVVVGIIALLTALLLTVTPRVYRAVYGARTNAQLAAIATAIQAYYGDYQSYPGPLANNQLGDSVDPTFGNDGSTAAYVLNNGGGNAIPLHGINLASGLVTKNITGSENLVLGLCGGVRVVPNGTTPPYLASDFVYDPNMIFPNGGTTAAPVGPASLNLNNPRQQQPYLQIKAGDLSVPNYSVNGGAFTDAANRASGDSCISEFMDKYGDPLPILYYRTNVGAKAIVGIRNSNDAGQALIDSGVTGAGFTPVPEQPQYDILQNLVYTSSKIGTVAGVPTSFHGLQGSGSENLGDPIMTNGAPTNNGKNGIAFFRDPNFVINLANPSASYDYLASNTHNGHARQKDAFLLISAGPDRLYGTPNNLIYPGTVTVSQ